MAKYIDQAGAQHFAEALMASTKTVGGQTIWGSGNIETGGGIKTYHITGDQEWLNNAEALASTEFKVVILDNVTGTIGSTASMDYILRNAIVTNNTYTNGNFISIGSEETANFYFINCSFVNNGGTNPTANIPYGCELEFQYSCFYFKNCDLKLVTPTASDCIFSHCANLYMTNCELRCDLSASYLVATRLTCIDSIIDGLMLASNSEIYVGTSNHMSIISRCAFETASDLLLAGASSTNVTIIEWCNLRYSKYSSSLYNVKYCTINKDYADRCHPYILSTQAVSETAAGGFNTIV